MTEKKGAISAHTHSHMWIVGALGMAAGLGLMIYVPSLTAISQGVLLFAGFHLAGAVVLLASLHVTGGAPLARKIATLAGAKRAAPERFDFVVWVPGWMMFAIANVMSFFLSPKRDWRRMAKSAGFEIVDEGMFNGIWFLLLKKPAPKQ